MKRPALFILAIVAATGMLFAATAPGQAARAALRLLDDSPVTFRGTGFRAHEHVKIVAMGGRITTRRVVAGAAGGFVVRMPGLDPNACTGFSASATGDRGSRASFKRAPGQCALP